MRKRAGIIRGRSITVVLCAIASMAFAAALSNGKIEAQFDDQGLVSIHDKQLKKTVRFSGDHWSLIIDHSLVDSSQQQVYLANLGEKFKKTRGLGDYAAFARMDDRWGAMFLIQNPFVQWKFQDGDFSMDYRADMVWHAKHGPFASDRACIGTYALTGQLGPGAIDHHGS